MDTATRRHYFYEPVLLRIATCSTGGGGEPWQALQSAAAGLAAQDVTSWSDDQVRDGTQRPPNALECAGVPMAQELPWSHWADRLPASVAQRLDCDCEVWRVILDPATGLPLEVGRAYRIVPTRMRKALIARDRGCRWPGCTAPASWCEVHHLLAWYHGGLSNVDNGVLMCRWHHGKVHAGLPDHQRWQITLDPTTGDVTVSRPGGEPYELAPTQPYRHPAEATRPEARA